MSIFDLLFVVLFLTTVGTLIVAAIAALRGRPTRRPLARLAIGAVVYFGALILTSLLTPPRTIGPGVDQCSDDWCIAVASARLDSVNAERGYEVTLRLSSRAGRVAQRERFVSVYLRDSLGRRYDPLVDAGAVPFDTLLQPGQSILAVRRFVVPAGVDVAGLVVAREGGGRFPGCCIIGDEGSLLHKRTIALLN